MHTILMLHIILMSLSVLATASTVIAAASGKKVRQSVKSTNLGITAGGIVCGIILLGAAPLDLRCAMLSAYVALFWASQLYIERRNDQLALTPES